MELHLIVAVSKNGVISVGDEIPWKVKDDMKLFKDITVGHPIIMGRKTWETFNGRPLPLRWHIVISKTLSSKNLPSSVIVVKSLEEALELVKDKEKAFIIGGGAIYEQAKPIVDVFHISKIDTVINWSPNLVYFVLGTEKNLKMVQRNYFPKKEGNEFSFEYNKFTRYPKDFKF